MTRKIVRRALLSVHDKSGLADLAAALAAAGVELISTGGTARAIAQAGLPVTDVATLTGMPEMLDGRVKTLHPAVHAALLADLDSPTHRAAIEGAGIAPIDLVVSNLYPFETAPGGSLDIELIDVGGPTMTRAAAKNFSHVAVVVEPADYRVLLRELAAGGTTLALRRQLAGKAFARLAAYDAAIAARFAQEQNGAPQPAAEPASAVDTRAWFALGGRQRLAMRYGENPHQRAAFYATSGGGIAAAQLVGGKTLSYNNVADADAALAAVADFSESPAAVVVKHANPCGIALGATLEEAYERARACDPVSAFGGVVALSQPLDGPCARAIASIFTEVVVAPGASQDALDIVSHKTNLRLVLVDRLTAPGPMVRTVAGGFLVQDADDAPLPELEVVSARQPSEAERADLLFAWRAVKHVKSNAIVFAKSGATVGVGAGQMSRLDAARIAAWKAADAAREAGEPEARSVGAVAASDAFFPFADGLEAIAQAGATAVIQPGGSRRDAEVIAAADRANVAMVFTGMRHFRH